MKGWVITLKCEKDVVILLRSDKRECPKPERVWTSCALSEPMAFGHGNHEFVLDGVWTHETYFWGEGGKESNYEGFVATIKLPEKFDLVVTPLTGWRFQKTFAASDEGTWWLDTTKGWEKED